MSILIAHQEIVDRLKRIRELDQVHEDEPAQFPGKGLYAAVWFDEIAVASSVSSLRLAGMLYTLNVRLYKAAIAGPGDSLDVRLVRAVDAFVTSLVGEVVLGASGYRVDALGAYSGGVRAATDYVDFGRKQMTRIVDVTVPIFAPTEKTNA